MPNTGFPMPEPSYRLRQREVDPRVQGDLQ